MNMFHVWACVCMFAVCTSTCTPIDTMYHICIRCTLFRRLLPLPALPSEVHSDIIEYSPTSSWMCTTQDTAFFGAGNVFGKYWSGNWVYWGRRMHTRKCTQIRRQRRRRRAHIRTTSMGGHILWETHVCVTNMLSTVLSWTSGMSMVVAQRDRFTNVHARTPPSEMFKSEKSTHLYPVRSTLRFTRSAHFVRTVPQSTSRTEREEEREGRRWLEKSAEIERFTFHWTSVNVAHARQTCVCTVPGRRTLIAIHIIGTPPTIRPPRQTTRSFFCVQTLPSNPSPR